MDLGLVIFFIFIAFWINFLRSRLKGGRVSRSVPGRLGPRGVTEPSRQLTLVGIEDRETAISGFMAITGASRDQAEVTMSNLPTTIPVAPGAYTSSLEILAESGIAYATGALGISDSFSGLPRPRPGVSGPPPAVVRQSPPPAPSSTRPAGEGGWNSRSENAQVPPGVRATPPELLSPEPEPHAEEPRMEPKVAPTWATLDPSTAPPEVAAAMAEPNRTVAERNLRRLSMNGVHEADVVLGLLLVDWGRTSEAEGMLRGRGHNDPVAANNLGVLDEIEGRMPSARRNYELAARLGSNEAVANLARLSG